MLAQFVQPLLAKQGDLSNGGINRSNNIRPFPGARRTVASTAARAPRQSTVTEEAEEEGGGRTVGRALCETARTTSDRQGLT